MRLRLRPSQAHWFETYVPRNETVFALEALAVTGVVQLELDTRLAQSLALEPVRELIQSFQTIRGRYPGLLPAAGRAPAGQVEAPEQTARQALTCLQHWSASMDVLLHRKTVLEKEQKNLQLLRECINAMQDASQDVEHLARKSQFLYKGVFACLRQQPLPADISAGITEQVNGREHNFFIIADEPGREGIITKAYKSAACYRLDVPDWLSARPHAHAALIEKHMADVDKNRQETLRAIEDKKNVPELAAALSNIDLLVWYLEHSAKVAEAGRLCHVSGWTTADDPGPLQQALHNADIHGVIRFATAPGFSRPPVNMGQPWWARPFLFIVQMLGTPDSTEIDTGKLVPFIVPLLFGYMFSDVGHGLVLVLLSSVLYRRWPAGRFLIPCGISAMLFGVVFGKVFGYGGLLEPLWISPLENPLPVLLAPLLVGIGLILLGLVFNGAEAVWRGEAGQWFLREAALLLMYPAVLFSLIMPQALWVALFALFWFLSGHVLAARSQRLRHLAAGVGLLLGSALELVLNTLSFLRVGAFALAHAALSSAVLGMAGGISDPVLHIVMLVVGNVFIITMEGLVAFVQTTRLVLFEFFIRFLKAEGRKFQPTTRPPEERDGGD